MSWLTAQIGRFIHNALKEAKKAKDSDSFGAAIALPEIARNTADHTDVNMPQTQFTVIKCSNGKLVKVSEYRPTKSHHPDWQHEIYIVKDDEKVPDVIARIMAIKALEQ